MYLFHEILHESLGLFLAKELRSEGARRRELGVRPREDRTGCLQVRGQVVRVLLGILLELLIIRI